jgi:hypothetical protein
LVLATFAGLGQLALAVREDVLIAAVELVLGGDIAKGAMEADVVVQLNNLKPAIPPSVKWSIHGTPGSANE